MEDQYQSLLYKAGLFIISLMSRWLLGPMSSLWDAYNHDDDGDDEARRHQHRVSAQAVRKMLQVATFRDIVSAGATVERPTCAVCLNQVRNRDRVWELRNCSHIFHMRCLDRWLDHDDQLTCPLCRAPLLASRGAATSLLSPSEASWAVEKLLYLFGDDLLFPHLSSPSLDIPSSLTSWSSLCLCGGACICKLVYTRYHVFVIKQSRGWAQRPASYYTLQCLLLVNVI